MRIRFFTNLDEAQNFVGELNNIRTGPVSEAWNPEFGIPAIGTHIYFWVDQNRKFDLEVRMHWFNPKTSTVEVELGAPARFNSIEDWSNFVGKWIKKHGHI